MVRVLLCDHLYRGEILILVLGPQAQWWWPWLNWMNDLDLNVIVRQPKYDVFMLAPSFPTLLSFSRALCSLDYRIRTA